MADTHFDPNRPVLWKMNLPQALTVACAVICSVFTVGGTWVATNSRLTTVETRIESIDKDGSQYAIRRNLDGRIAQVETHTAEMDKNGTQFSQRGVTSDREFSQQTADRVALLEKTVSELLPKVERIDVNTQWMMKQQASK